LFLLDYMFSSDVFVADMRLQADLLVSKLGIHPPSPRAIVTDSPEAHATMLRLDRSFANAPTRLEIIQPARLEGHWNVNHIQEAWQAQRDRPVRFHNTVYIGDVPALVEDFSRRGIPHMTDDSISFVRLWIGIDPRNPARYDPSFDGGQRIEILPYSYFPVPSTDGVSPDEGDEPRIERVANRSFLVPDLEMVTRALERTLDWIPASPITRGTHGDRTVTYSLPRRNSGGLVLIQPADGSAAGKFAKRHGYGPYTLQLKASRLERWPELLSERGVANRVEESPLPVVTIESGPVGDVRLQLVA
jgi:hypothetical protein